MENGLIKVPFEDVKGIDISEYRTEIVDYFPQMPEVSKPLLKEMNTGFAKIEKMLYSVPSIINAVRAIVPEIELQAVLTDEQKQKIAEGALQLMAKKDGTLLANLVNPETKKIVSTIPLKTVKLTPEITQAMTSFSMQMQLAQIAEQIQKVHLAIEEVYKGQEYDRLAAAYSCEQKFLQTMEIKNPTLKAMALLQIASSAEDSRNLLMLSQMANVKFIASQPESFFEKIFSGASPEKIDSRMDEIKESLIAVNKVSLIEAMAYQQMGESEAARRSLTYYAEHLQNTYFTNPKLVERLDLIDKSPEKYWSKLLPNIRENIMHLPCMENTITLQCTTPSLLHENQEVY